jgi:serine/threonine protein kinase
VTYVDQKADVFILGVILFNIVTGGDMPFEEAAVDNGKYKYFVKKKYDLYWKYQQPQLSLALQSLLNSIFEVNPVKRPSLNDILNSEWMSRPDQIPQPVEQVVLSWVTSSIKETDYDRVKLIKYYEE